MKYSKYFPLFLSMILLNAKTQKRKASFLEEEIKKTLRFCVSAFDKTSTS